MENERIDQDPIQTQGVLGLRIDQDPIQMQGVLELRPGHVRDELGRGMSASRSRRSRRSRRPNRAHGDE
jgi:hypothetical protein